MSLRALICGLVLATTSVSAAKERVSLRVSPAVAMAPANLVIQARVEPDAGNRAIEIVADSEGFYRSSTIQLEGDRAPRTTTFIFQSLPGGEYELSAVVTGADGQPRATTRAHVNIIESALSR